MKNLEKYIYLKDLVADCGGIDKFKFMCYVNKKANFTTLTW